MLAEALRRGIRSDAAAKHGAALPLHLARSLARELAVAGQDPHARDLRRRSRWATASLRPQDAETPALAPAMPDRDGRPRRRRAQAGRCAVACRRRGRSASPPDALALHRLRQLLGDPEVHSHERRKSQPQSRARLGRCVVPSYTPAQRSKAAFHEIAATLYRGDFLEDEAEEAWVLPAREQLRSLHAQAVRGLADGATARPI